MTCTAKCEAAAGAAAPVGYQPAPRSLRLHIGLFGRRNVGKSSVLNALTRQQVAIVSDIAGTTTDPVEKPMELLPVGPVLFIDTAGIDDEGALGALRIAKTRACFDRTDLGIIVTDGAWGPYEEQLTAALRQRGTPLIVVRNKADCGPASPALSDLGLPLVDTVAPDGTGLAALRQAIVDHAPADFIAAPDLLGDLVEAGDLVVLVVPLDKEAPKGRLIMPQVQTIRALLDRGASALMTGVEDLPATLARLKDPPKLVITDSQAFQAVDALTPRTIPLTSFSILFSRFKGDLLSQTMGAMAIDALKPGDKVLIAEGCTHHAVEDDIGRVKIPRWLQNYVGGTLEITNSAGRDYPADLADYKLIVHCGACTFNRKEMLGRILKAREAGVPITNYGLTIAFSLGIFARALQPFPDVHTAYEAARQEAGA